MGLRIGKVVRKKHRSQYEEFHVFDMPCKNSLSLLLESRSHAIQFKGEHLYTGFNKSYSPFIV